MTQKKFFIFTLDANCWVFGCEFVPTETMDTKVSNLKQIKFFSDVFLTYGVLIVVKKISKISNFRKM